MSGQRGKGGSRLEGRDDEGTESGEVPRWVAPFLAGLIVTGSVREAVDEAGIDFDTAWALRREYPVFAMYWDRAVRVHKRVMDGADFLDAEALEEAGVE